MFRCEPPEGCGRMFSDISQCPTCNIKLTLVRNIDGRWMSDIQQVVKFGAVYGRGDCWPDH